MQYTCTSDVHHKLTVNRPYIPKQGTNIKGSFFSSDSLRSLLSILYLFMYMWTLIKITNRWHYDTIMSPSNALRQMATVPWLQKRSHAASIKPCFLQCYKRIYVLENSGFLHKNTGKNRLWQCNISLMLRDLGNLCEWISCYCSIASREKKSV